jgi:hypothetical protein
MPFAEDQDMIEALASKRPDQAFNVRVLPGGDRGAIGRSRIPIILTRFVKACP